jgi:predicted RNase H-related nuclease YkuK (DUF458 family)
VHPNKIRQIQDFIRAESPTSKIFIGCDSEAYSFKGERMADYYLVVVVHINGRNGCKIFGDKITERDYSKDKRKPTFRLMNEVYKASALYLELADAIGEREVEIHLDLNPDKRFASNLVLEQAIGYVKGTCNVIPLVKPDSWVATHVADKMLKVVNKR